jgi:hypothetical protein
VHTTHDSPKALKGVFSDGIVSKDYGQHIHLILLHATFTYGVILRTVYRTNRTNRNFGSSSGRTSLGEFQPI